MRMIEILINTVVLKVLYLPDVVHFSTNVKHVFEVLV